MKLLALDTSSLACSVALQLDGAVFSRHEERPREHTRLLVPMIRDVLDEAGATIVDLDGVALGNGPGSFIGMRIAASVAQGIAMSAGLPVRPVSSMAAVALQAGEEDSGRVAVAQDAHMKEVYFGLYDITADGDASLVWPERLQAQAPIDGLENCIAAGAGWQRYPQLLELNRAGIRAVSDVLYPDARYLLRLAQPGYEAASMPADEVLPAYLRQKVAETPGRKST